MILVECVTAKVTLYVKTDVKGRRLGEQIGLDTLVVQAENYECYILQKECINESVSIPPHE